MEEQTPGPLRLHREPSTVARQNAFPYQIEAIEAIKDREYAAVFHEQGLGKTKIAVDVLLHWLRSRTVDTVLLVTKKSLLANWEREFVLHTQLRPRKLSGDTRSNYHLLNSPVRVILTHFEAIHKERERIRLFSRTRRLGIIIDESARLKNPDAALTQTFMGLSDCFVRRVIMTGTPVANRPEDIWSQIWFLDRGASLGDDHRAFATRVRMDKKLSDNTEAQENFRQALEDIQWRIASFSVRETKASGVVALPDKLISVAHGDWETHQLDMYRQVRDDLRLQTFRGGLPNEEEEEPILRRLLRLIQIASNPGLVDPSYRATPGKMAVLEDILYAAHDQGEKAIVWTTFTDNVDWLAGELRGFGARRVHGKLAMDTRERSISAFMSDPSVEVLIATPAAAKEGLTLTAANHVVFFDRSFSLDDYLQAQDRIHRISQTRTCHVHNIIMPDSIDEWVAILLEAKQTAAQLAQGDLTSSEFQAKMRFDFHEMLRVVLGDA